MLESERILTGLDFTAVWILSEEQLQIYDGNIGG